MRANKESIRDVLIALTDRMRKNETLGRWHTIRCGVLNMYISDHIVNTKHEYRVNVFYREMLFFNMTYTEHGSIAKLINTHDTDFWAIELFAQWLSVLKYCTDLKYYIDSTSTIDVAREKYLRAMIEAEAPIRDEVTNHDNTKHDERTT